MTLNVPITMGNAFQDSIGYIDWEFKVEELPIADSDPKLPKTGDSSDILLYSLTMGISLFALILLLLAAKRRRQAFH